MAGEEAEGSKEEQEPLKGEEKKGCCAPSDEEPIDKENPSCCCCSAGEKEPNALASNAIIERSRWCTDFPMLIAFLCFVVGLGIVAELAFTEGNPDRIMYGTNWQGNTCNTGKLKGYDAQFWANPFFYKEMGSLCLSPEISNSSDGCPQHFPWDTPGEAQVACYCNNKLYNTDEMASYYGRLHPVDDVSDVVGFECQTVDWVISTTSGTQFSAGETLTINGDASKTATIAIVQSAAAIHVYNAAAIEAGDAIVGQTSGATGNYHSLGARSAKYGGVPAATTGFFMKTIYSSQVDADAAETASGATTDAQSLYIPDWSHVLPEGSSSGMYLSSQYCIPDSNWQSMSSDSCSPFPACTDPAYPACTYLRRVVPICSPTYSSKKQFNRCIPSLDLSDLLNLFGAKACGGKELNSTNLGDANNAAQSSYCAEDHMSDLFSGIQEFATEAFADLERSWDIVLAMGLVAFALGFVYLFLMRYCACCIIWTTMLTVLASLIGLALGFYYYYDKVMDRVNIKPQLESHEMDSRNAKILLAFTIIFSILAAVQVGLIAFFGRQITAAARILMVAAEALIDMPHLVLYPIGNCVVVLLFFVYWCFVTLFLASAGSDSYDKEWGTHEWAYDQDLKNAFVYHLFGFFWIVEFIAAVGLMVLAFCTAMWFFAPRPEGATADSSERDIPEKILRRAIRMTVCNHLGTVATGSLIIAIVQMLKVMLEYAERKKKELGLSDNRIVKFIFMILRCCLWCLEKCVRWLNKHVYIQTVITGCWFCSGICKVARALLNNLSYIAMCGYVSTAMLWFGKVAVALGTGAIGVSICETRELTSVMFPGFLMICIGYGVATMFCGVYELVIDTMLMCFCEAKMNDSGCIPKALETYMSAEYHRRKEEAVVENAAPPEEEANPIAKKEDPEVTKNDVPPVIQVPSGELSTALLEEMRSKFERYDLDGSGTINSHEELQQLMVNLYFALSTKAGVESIKPEVIAERVVGAGDMEANNWEFDAWAEWVKAQFPEMVGYQG